MNKRENRFCRLIATQVLSRSDAARLERYVTAGADWPTVAQDTFREGLSPLFYYHCRNLDLLSYLPQETRRYLGRIYAETSIINRHILRTMDELGDALKRRSLDVIVFKGAALLNDVYHDIALRQMEDIDLLVKQEFLDDLRGLLESMGFVQSRFCANSYYKGIMSFDLHTDYVSSHRISGRQDLMDVKAADMWCMSVPVSGGAFLRRLSLYDNLIALSFHLLKHRYRGLIWFVDIAEVIKKNQSALSWEELVKYSRMVRAERILLYAFLLMKHLVGFDVPDSILIDLGKNRLCFMEKILLRLCLTNADPGALIYILWILQVHGVTRKIRFARETMFPRQEVMNQMFPASLPCLHVFLRRVIDTFSRISINGVSAFRAVAKNGLPPL
ncbi:MAG: nucleotidyltransferase family protein [Deltaproteobacteria bacterium]|nr:nucleotidyltransferase family protein [Deltaproteobacteria bacterium]